MKRLRGCAERMWVLGVLFVAFGVALCGKAGLGVSMLAAPAFILHDALSPLWSGFSVGTVSYLIQGVLLLILWVTVRRMTLRYLLSFAVAVIYGYVLDFFLWVLAAVNPETLWTRWTVMLIGDIFTALGVACFFKTYLPLQVFELFVAEVTARFSLSLHKFKLVFDFLMLGLSVALVVFLFDHSSFDPMIFVTENYHSIGLGTVVTTAINAPLIALITRGLDRYIDTTPRFPRLREKLL